MWIKNGEYAFSKHIAESITIWLYGGVNYRKLKAMGSTQDFWFVQFLYLEI